MQESVNAIREQRGEEPLSAAEFLKLAKEACKQVQLPLDFLKRGVNEGFSGGEKKRNEIMQMILLKPSLCILDESDSGLDIDALQVVANGVNSQRSPDRSFIVVTHYQRLLDYIKPDFVHILADGKIVKSGDASLALEVEKEGYAFLGKAYEEADA
jgi:Fe-S cluster assembly ATP-binding protein